MWEIFWTTYRLNLCELVTFLRAFSLTSSHISLFPRGGGESRLNLFNIHTCYESSNYQQSMQLDNTAYDILHARSHYFPRISCLLITPAEEQLIYIKTQWLNLIAIVAICFEKNFHTVSDTTTTYLTLRTIIKLSSTLSNPLY